MTVDQPRHNGPSPRIDETGLWPRQGIDLRSPADRYYTFALHRDGLGETEGGIDRYDLAAA